MVIVEPYNQNWPLRFCRQASELRTALGGRITRIEHVGSTAVVGLPAKPIIDIAACTALGVDPFSLTLLIDRLGFQQHQGGPQTHAVYVRESRACRTEILHVFTEAAWPTCNQRIIRDKLQHDETARREYGELKLRLAASQITDLEYTAAKVSLIQKLLDEERTERGLPAISAWEK